MLRLFRPTTSGFELTQFLTPLCNDSAQGSSEPLRCIYAEGVDLATLTSEQRAVPGPCDGAGPCTAYATPAMGGPSGGPRPGSGSAESIFGRTAQPNAAGSSEKKKDLTVQERERSFLFAHFGGLGDTGAQQAAMPVVCTNRAATAIERFNHSTISREHLKALPVATSADQVSDSTGSPDFFR